MSGGLPDAPDLAAAFAARPNRRKPEPPPRPVEEPETPPEPEAAPEPPPEPEKPSVALLPAQAAAPATPAPKVDIELPNLGALGRTTMQCAVNIDLGVQDRFNEYQADRKTATGREPTNAVVIRRAVAAANKEEVFGELLEAALLRLRTGEEADDDSDSLFGEVEGRKESRGRTKTTGQQPFRPSRQELAVIDAIWQGYHFPSRSDFLNAVLDWWLPKAKKRRSI